MIVLMHQRRANHEISRNKLVHLIDGEPGRPDFSVRSRLIGFLPIAPLQASRRVIDSDRDQSAHPFGFHVLAAPLLHDFAPGHHQVLVGQFGGEIVELLDQ